MNPDLLDRLRNACSNGDLTLVRDILQSINNILKQGFLIANDNQFIDISSEIINTFPHISFDHPFNWIPIQCDECGKPAEFFGTFIYDSLLKKSLQCVTCMVTSKLAILPKLFGGTCFDGWEKAHCANCDENNYKKLFIPINGYDDISEVLCLNCVRKLISQTT